MPAPAFEAAIRSSNLPWTARLVALTLSSYADPTTGQIPTNAMPDVPTLAAATGMREVTVRKCLHFLGADGYLGRFTRRKTHTIQYKLLTPGQ